MWLHIFYCCPVTKSCLTLCDSMDWRLLVFQAFLSFTISWSLLRLMSIELVMLYNHPLLSPSPFAFNSIKTFPVSQLFTSGGQNIGASTSASILPMNVKTWFCLGLTGLISWLSKGLSRVFASTTIRKHQWTNLEDKWHKPHIEKQITTWCHLYMSVIYLYMKHLNS